MINSEWEYVFVALGRTRNREPTTTNPAAVAAVFEPETRGDDGGGGKGQAQEITNTWQTLLETTPEMCLQRKEITPSPLQVEENRNVYFPQASRCGVVFLYILF